MPIPTTFGKRKVLSWLSVNRRGEFNRKDGPEGVRCGNSRVTTFNVTKFVSSSHYISLSRVIMS